MTQYDWFVDFERDGGVMVRAGSRDEALVLAKAQRIKGGLQWRGVVSAECRGVSSPRIRRPSPLA